MTRHAGGSSRSRGRTEDRSRAADVSVHARLGDPQQIGDLLRRETARDSAEDLTLTIGQRDDGPAAPREDSPGKHVPAENPEHHESRPLHRTR